jgi:hypothetical protein
MIALTGLQGLTGRKLLKDQPSAIENGPPERVLSMNCETRNSIRIPPACIKSPTAIAENPVPSIVGHKIGIANALSSEIDDHVFSIR